MEFNRFENALQFVNSPPEVKTVQIDKKVDTDVRDEQSEASDEPAVWWTRNSFYAIHLEASSFIFQPIKLVPSQILLSSHRLIFEINVSD